MIFLKKALHKLDSTYSAIKEKSHNAISEISSKISTIQSFKVEKHLVEVYPRIYWMSYPDAKIILHLAAHLNQTF